MRPCLKFSRRLPNAATMPLPRRSRSPAELRRPRGGGALNCKTSCGQLGSVAEWIHFTLFGIISPTIKLKVYTFGAYELSN